MSNRRSGQKGHEIPIRAFEIVRLVSFMLAGTLYGCGPAGGYGLINQPEVLTSTTILADITRNVAGNLMRVDSILPVGIDPHGFQPVPADLAKISESRLLILNGAGYEDFLAPVLESADGDRTIIEATTGLVLRQDLLGSAGLDPHLWLDPNKVIVYVQNIRDGLIRLDHQSESIYRSNAESYIANLQELDDWITGQVAQLSPERRLLISNHEALGYFAERYGFKIAGTILASTSSQASISAQELRAVIEEIRASGVPAIFLDEVENTDLASQVAAETGVKIVADLHLESLTDGPPAATYIDLMKYNVSRIVEALK